MFVRPVSLGSLRRDPLLGGFHGSNRSGLRRLRGGGCRTLLYTETTAETVCRWDFHPQTAGAAAAITAVTAVHVFVRAATDGVQARDVVLVLDISLLHTLREVGERFVSFLTMEARPKEGEVQVGGFRKFRLI